MSDKFGHVVEYFAASSIAECTGFVSVKETCLIVSALSVLWQFNILLLDHLVVIIGTIFSFEDRAFIIEDAYTLTLSAVDWFLYLLA